MSCRGGGKVSAFTMMTDEEFLKKMRTPIDRRPDATDEELLKLRHTVLAVNQRTKELSAILKGIEKGEDVSFNCVMPEMEQFVKRFKSEHVADGTAVVTIIREAAIAADGCYIDCMNVLDNMIVFFSGLKPLFSVAKYPNDDGNYLDRVLEKGIFI